MTGKKNISRTITFLTPFVIASVIRILLGYFAGAWFPGSEFWDDALLARHSEIIAHFKYPNPTSMLKYIGYSFFVWIVGLSKIPITVWTSLLWLFAGYLTYYVACRLGLNKCISFCAFLYISFMPEAFENWCGTRLYRNSIIGPFVAISLLLMIVLFFKLSDCGKKNSHPLIWSVIVGLLVSFTYFIKEDGIWLLACLLFAMLVWGINIFVSRKKFNRKKTVNALVSVFLPVIILSFVSLGYKAIDYKCFGVFETNTRTGGASGEFMSLIYSIESPNRTAEIWAPVDAIEKAFEESETLKNHPALLECIIESPWLRYDIYNNPIPGDMLGWVLYSAGPDSATWSNDVEKEAFFRKVNLELKEAFKDGRLEKSKGRISIVSSAGSRTLSEIFDLRDEVLAGYKGAILYDGYVFGVQPFEMDLCQESTISVIALMKRQTGLWYLDDLSPVIDRFNNVAKVTKAISYLYIVINILLVILFFTNIVYGLICLVKGCKIDKLYFANNISTYIKWFISVVFAGIGFLYTFFIGWFSSFLNTQGIDKVFTNYYNVALPVLLGLSYLFALGFFFDLSKRNINSEKD